MVTLMKSFDEVFSDLRGNIHKEEFEFAQQYLEGFEEVFGIRNLKTDMNDFYEIKIFTVSNKGTVFLDNIYVPTTNLDAISLINEALLSDYLHKGIQVDIKIYKVKKLEYYFQLKQI